MTPEEIQDLVDRCYEHYEWLWDGDDSPEGAADKFNEMVELERHIDGLITDEQLALKFKAYLENTQNENQGS